MTTQSKSPEQVCALILKNWSRIHLISHFPSVLTPIISNYYFTIYFSKLSQIYKSSNIEINDLTMTAKRGNVSQLIRMETPLPVGIISTWQICLDDGGTTGCLVGIISNLDDNNHSINYTNGINPNFPYEWKSIFGIDMSDRYYYESPLRDWKLYDLWSRTLDCSKNSVYQVIADFRDHNNKKLKFKINGEYINCLDKKNIWCLNIPNKTGNGEIHEKWYPLIGFYTNYRTFQWTVKFPKSESELRDVSWKF